MIYYTLNHDLQLSAKVECTANGQITLEGQNMFKGPVIKLLENIYIFRIGDENICDI